MDGYKNTEMVYIEGNCVVKMEQQTHHEQKYGKKKKAKVLAFWISCKNCFWLEQGGFVF